MYQIFARAAGGRIVAIPPRPDFALPVGEITRAITAHTRIVFVNTPHNPTGLVIPRDALRELVRAVPATVTVLIDEAYCDFSGETFLPDLPTHPNVLIGRTFAKAHGLAGLRAGCLIGAPSRLEMVREVVPPYSLSVFAVAGWRAALRDPQYLASYRKQVEDSRNLLYAACERLGLRYWRSGANFVLIKVGGDTDELVRDMAARGVLVRDRSRDPGCRGCIRITAGIVKHTEAAVQALEALCAVR
jgi:histidinol-phosphate aminotransferase